MRTLADLLLKNKLEREKKIAIVDDNVNVNYGELFDKSHLFADALFSWHRIRGNRVAVWLPNCPEFLYTYFGAALSGNIAVPLAANLVAEEVRHFLNFTQTSTLITNETLWEKLSHSRGMIPGVQNIILNSHSTIEGTIPIQSFIGGSTTPFTAPFEICENDVVVFLCTSGSTGVPKAVMCSHRNLLSNVLTDIDVYQMRETDNCSCMLSMAHNYCMVENCLLPLACGAAIVLGDLGDTHGMLRKIDKFKITVLTSMPPELSGMTREGKTCRHNLSSLRLVQSGGASLAPILQKRFQEIFKLPIVMGYGCTEVSASCTEIPLEGPYKDRSVGKVIPNQRIRLVGKDGRDVKTGQEGEICVSGPNVFQGYYGNPEATKSSLQKGWFRTNDMGRLDEDGFLYVLGRKGSKIKTEAGSIYPTEVANVLFECDGVVEVSVFSVIKNGKTELISFVEMPGAQPDSRETILNYCRSRLPAYGVPTYLEVRKKLPRTATGKIATQVLQQELK
ncbi:MAG: class I adenylate-forming enzyme family protein [Bdellovibrionota bacterium]